jgi:hypothetical protein
MSRIPGNPPAPAGSTGVAHLPVDHVDRSAGHYVIITSSHQGIRHPPAPEHFAL